MENLITRAEQLQRLRELQGDDLELCEAQERVERVIFDLVDEFGGIIVHPDKMLFPHERVKRMREIGGELHEK